MTPERSTATVFRYSPSMRRFSLIISSVSVGFAVYIVSFSPVSSFDRLFTSLFFPASAILCILYFFTSEIEIGDVGVIERTFFFSKTLRWREVEDFVHSPRLLLLTGRGGRTRIGVFRAEYGFSLEPFEDLREAIVRRIQSPLVEKWKQISLVGGRIYPYPPFSLGQVLAYLVPLSLVGFSFVFAPLWWGVFQGEQLLFFAMAAVSVVPFFVRDYRRTRKKIILREEGIAEENGKSTFFLWKDISRLIIKDIWYGSVVIVGSSGEKITIPRRIQRCGELLFLLMSRSRPTIVDSFEY